MDREKHRTLKCVMLDFGGTMMYLARPFDEILDEGDLATFEFVRKLGMDVELREYSETSRRVFSKFRSIEEAENRDIPDTDKYYAVAAELFPGRTDGETKRISRTMCDLFWDIVSGYQVPFPGLADVLGKLKQDGRKLGIVSNHHNGGSLRSWLAKNDLDRFFDAVVVSSEVGFRKPDGRIFKLALDRLGAIPDETVFVGDDLRNDIMGAAAAGMETVLFRSRSPGLNSGESGASGYSIHNFRELLNIF